MANYVVSDTNLTLIADAIRAKSGHNELLEWPNEYKTGIDNLNPVDMCIKTVTDDVVSVSDAAQYDAKNVSIKIGPVQDLNGYDSPWPAGGGKNILDPNLKFSTQTVRGVTLTTNNGYEYKLTGTGESGSGNLQTNNIPTAECLVYPAGTYTVVGFVASTYHPDGSWFSNRSGTFTVDEDFIIRAGYREVAAGTSYNTSAFIAMVKGSTAPTMWTPYSNICPISGWTGVNVYHGADQIDYETLAITFPASAGTVYGGTLDVTKGVLTVDRAMVDLGTLTFSQYTGYPGLFYISGFSGSTAVLPASNNTLPSAICSLYKPAISRTIGTSGHTIGEFALAFPDRLYIADDRYIGDAKAFKTAMSGVQLVYELATPITYTLTPQQIAMLRGDNALWADTGDTTLTYYTEDFTDLADEIGYAEGGDY